MPKSERWSPVVERVARQLHEAMLEATAKIKIKGRPEGGLVGFDELLEWRKEVYWHTAAYLLENPIEIIHEHTITTARKGRSI